jgi:hypothetical protein
MFIFKKLIANINIGLLEKSNNVAQRSFIFEDLTELKYYHERYGGDVNIIEQYVEEDEQIADDLGLDYGTNAMPSIKRHFVKDDKFFYALKHQR